MKLKLFFLTLLSLLVFTQCSEKNLAQSSDLTQDLKQIAIKMDSLKIGQATYDLDIVQNQSVSESILDLKFESNELLLKLNYIFLADLAVSKLRDKYTDRQFKFMHSALVYAAYRHSKSPYKRVKIFGGKEISKPPGLNCLQLSISNKKLLVSLNFKCLVDLLITEGV